MTDTVRIMPRQPIEAERINRPPAFRSLGREVLHHDGHETFLSARYWHEVSDPIVWDGCRASAEAIWEAAPEWVPFVDAHPCGSELILRLDLPTGARISIEGDSFAILPPAKDGAE